MRARSTIDSDIFVAVAPVATDFDRAVLTGDEIERAGMFTCARRREEFLAARWLAREVLADVARVDAGSLPPLLGPLPFVVADRYVGLSHSNGMVAVAVSTRSVAVDIETEGAHMTRLAYRFAGAAATASAMEATKAWTRWEAGRKLQTDPGRVISWRVAGPAGSYAVSLATA